MLEPGTCSETWEVAAVSDHLEVGRVVDLVTQVMVDPVVMVGLGAVILVVMEARHMGVRAVLAGLQADQVVGLVDKVQVDQAAGLVDQDLGGRVVLGDLVQIPDVQVVLETWETQIVRVAEPGLVGLALGMAANLTIASSDLTGRNECRRKDGFLREEPLKNNVLHTHTKLLWVGSSSGI